MRKKGLIITIGVAALIVIGSVWLMRSDDKRLPLVAITQIATHPALDEVRAGIVKGLSQRGYEDGRDIEILFRNANGDASLTTPIAEDFVRRNPTVIVPISTPSTIAIANATKDIPIVFSGVADPVGSGLVQDLETPSGGNVTGVCDRWPFRAQVQAFFDIFPESRRIGMMYTKGDDVSRIGVEAMEEISSEMGFYLRLLPVTAPHDIYPSALSLLLDVDTIYTGIDHLILENMDGLVKAANEAGKPLFGGESGCVEKGAVLALSIDMTEFGDVTAEMIVKVLEGGNPGDMPVRVLSKGHLMINRQAAKAFGLDVAALETGGAIIMDKSGP